MKQLLIATIMCCLFCKCNPASTENSGTAHTLPEYATGFKLSTIGNTKKLEVVYPFPGATNSYTYLLVPREEEIPDHEGNAMIIRTPVNSIVCTSTTHIPLLDYIDETDKLTGFPTTDFISSRAMRARIDSGMVVELGIDQKMNLEILFTLKPDLVMGYSMTRELGQLKKIQELGIPVVLNSEYLEKHPLGRAEWIKFMALFFNKEKEADSIFNYVKKEYLQSKALVEQRTTAPTVMSGVVYGDTWFLPGGQNYAGRLFEDAGLNYLWSDNSSRDFLELSFEAVYAKAREADLWIGVGSFESLAELEAADQRYGNFKSFNDKKVYTYNARKGAKGGSEYLELGYLRPDLVLKDLIKIGHPELLPGHDLYFHGRLE